MKQLASVYPHFIEEGRNVALIMAGLPAHVSQLVSNKSVSFLRRARQHHLGRIDGPDIETALRKTIVDGGASIDDPAVLETVSAVDGFPYMTQEPRDGVLATTYRELSKGDIRFLEAMLPDQQPSSLADVVTRMGVRSNYASKYKERLIDAGVLGDVGQGFYTIDPPGFKDYVREHAGR